MAKAQTAEKTETESAGASQQPLFFKEPHAVDAKRHAEAGLKKNVGYGFAKNTNSVPLTIHEMIEVARSYPIVFTAEETPMPLAVVGIKKENVFIDSKGEWDAQHYIPGYVRKYPFALLELPENEQFVLCMDEGSDHYQAKNPDMKLYENGEPTDFSKQAIDLCGMYHSQQMATQDFGRLLKEQGLLEGKEMQAELPNGEKSKLAGFQLISEDAWTKLPDEQFLKWREKNWLGLIYLVMASQTNWRYLAQREPV